jgi:hypothetical protein
MMSVEDATIVREILDKAKTDNYTDMRIVKELSAAGFKRTK